MNSLFRRRILRQLAGGTPRPGYELAAAIRAHTGESLLHAAHTERALEGADPRFERIRREIDIATLTIRAEFEHEPGVYWKLVRTHHAPLQERSSRFHVEEGKHERAVEDDWFCLAKTDAYSADAGSHG